MSAAARALAARAVVRAGTQIGTVESPRNSNRVPYWVRTRPSWNGLFWCLAFVTDCYLAVGVDIRGLFYGNPFHAGEVARFARKMGWWKTSNPKTGDIAIFAEYLHGEIVVSGTTDIGGNTSDGRGSFNNGGGVYRNVRSVGSRTGQIIGWVDAEKMIDYLISTGKVKAPTAPKPTPAPTKPSPSKPSPSKPPVATPTNLTVDGVFGAKSITALNRLTKRGATSTWDKAARVAFQKWLGVTADGVVGPKTITALQRRVGATADGKWGTNTTKALQRYLNAR